MYRGRSSFCSQPRAPDVSEVEVVSTAKDGGMPFRILTVFDFHD